jgi:hypothetical protein
LSCEGDDHGDGLDGTRSHRPVFDQTRAARDPSIPLGPFDDADRLSIVIRTVSAPQNEHDEEDRPSPFGWFPLLILIVLIVGGLFVMFELRDVSNVQDCVQSGRKNCAPIDPTNAK